MQVKIDEYTPPGPVGQKFLYSKGPIDIIMGPGGSGKTVASIVKGPLLAATWFPVCHDNVIPVRLAATRDTYRDMARTALNSWHETFPEDHPYTVSYKGGLDRPVEHVLEWDVIRQSPRGPVRCRVHFEMQFGAVGDNDIQQFFKGYELTAGWMNECDMQHPDTPGWMLSRTGRYPPFREIVDWEKPRILEQSKKQAARLGFKLEDDEDLLLPRLIWGDCNPPDYSNWVVQRCMEKPEENPAYNFFQQPGGLSDQAENRAGKKRAAYELELKSMDEYTAHRMVHGLPGYDRKGKPVYPTFKLHYHRSDGALVIHRDLPLGLGLDAGGSPACGIGQFMPNGQLRMLREICCDPGTGPGRFAEAILEVLISTFSGMPVSEAWADPSAWYGADKQAGELAHMEIVARALNIPIQPAPSNEPGIRQDAVRWYLNREIDGKIPGLIIDPSCVRTIGGFAAHYKLSQRASEGRTDRLEVEKNEYSHIHDGWQYLCLGHRGKAALIRDSSKFGRPDNVTGIRDRRSSPPVKRGAFRVFT